MAGGDYTVFRVGDLALAVPVSVVRRVVLAVEPRPLPGAPPGVRGFVDVAGNALPLYDLRQRFGLPARRLAVSDHFLVVTTGRREVVLWVDAVDGARSVTADAVRPAPDLGTGVAAGDVVGVLALAEGLVLIQDVERLLTAAEEAQVTAALRAAAGLATEVVIS
jgi:purine-binding chemotaxis protein CheW